MEKEFVPYEQSLALKELGFDEPCLAFYWITGKFYITAEYHNYVGFHKQNQLGDYNYDSISAPTFSQAFRWFRKNYGLEHKILRDSYGCRYQITKVTPTTLEDIDYKGQYSNTSYEEAEIECLKKLIEIVKK
jgi:hypothetical protein